MLWIGCQERRLPDNILEGLVNVVGFDSFHLGVLNEGCGAIVLQVCSSQSVQLCGA
jgi:hypothetical protein